MYKECNGSPHAKHLELMSMFANRGQPTSYSRLWSQSFRSAPGFEVAMAKQEKSLHAGSPENRWEPDLVPQLPC